jgi:hypothetical protein
MRYRLKINSTVWNRESNSLFDYETEDYHLSNCEINRSGFLFRLNKKIAFARICENKSSCYLASVKVSNNDFIIRVEERFLTDTQKDFNDNWIVIRHTYFKDEFGYKLREGDVIKFGKVIFRVCQVRTGSEKNNVENNYMNHPPGQILKSSVPDNRTSYLNQQQENFNQTNNFQNEQVNITNTVSNNNGINLSNNLILSNNVNLIKVKGKVLDMKKQGTSSNFSNVKRKTFKKKSDNNINANICRICLGDNSEGKDLTDENRFSSTNAFEPFGGSHPSIIENLLISVCKCIGSVKFIHIGCLRRWLSSKVLSKAYNFLSVYTYRTFQCELCKANIPDKVLVRGEVVNLISGIENDSENGSLTLECIKEKVPGEEDKKTLYVIKLKHKKSISMGRSTEADVRMTDISVSRNHSMIQLHEGHLYLKDLNSKFGTHIQLQSDICILPNKKLAIQCSKSFLTFNLAKTCISRLLCYKGFQTKFVKYNDYNSFLESTDAIIHALTNHLTPETNHKINTNTSNWDKVVKVEVDDNDNKEKCYSKPISHNESYNDYNELDDDYKNSINNSQNAELIISKQNSHSNEMKIVEDNKESLEINSNKNMKIESCENIATISMLNQDYLQKEIGIKKLLSAALDNSPKRSNNRLRNNIRIKEELLQEMTTQSQSLMNSHLNNLNNGNLCLGDPKIISNCKKLPSQLKIYSYSNRPNPNNVKEESKEESLQYSISKSQNQKPNKSRTELFKKSILHNENEDNSLSIINVENQNENHFNLLNVDSV